MNDSEQLVALVTQIEMALAIVAQRLRDQQAGLVLQKIELELNVQVTKKIEIGGKADFGVSLDASASTEWKNKHTVAISLTPRTTIKLGKPEHEELADALFALALATVKVSKAGAPNFALNEASLSIEIGINRQGKIQIIAGPGGGTESSHKINLSFRPA
jgi:Trypsin-co-occurring domain 2